MNLGVASFWDSLTILFAAKKKSTGSCMPIFSRVYQGWEIKVDLGNEKLPHSDQIPNLDLFLLFWDVFVSLTYPPKNFRHRYSKGCKMFWSRKNNSWQKPIILLDIYSSKFQGFSPLSPWRILGGSWFAAWWSFSSPFRIGLVLPLPNSLYIHGLKPWGLRLNHETYVLGSHPKKSSLAHSQPPLSWFSGVWEI